MAELKDKITKRIHGKGRGVVYISKDFLDLGNRAAVDQALSRLVKAGILRRLRPGLFDYPRVSKTLGVLSPDPDQMADALARKRGGRAKRSGASVANALGLTTQVAGRASYVTDASSATVRVGTQTMTMRKVSPKKMPSDRSVSGSVIQALEFLGREGVTDGVLDRLRSTLAPADMRRLLRESRYASGWLADAVKKIAKD